MAWNLEVAPDWPLSLSHELHDNGMDNDQRIIAWLAIIGVLLLIFFISPPGQLVWDFLTWIPGGVWGWIVGVVCVVGAVFAFKQL